MKKLAAMSIMAVMVLGMAACGSKEEAPAEENTAEEETAEEAPAEEAEASEEERTTFTVGFDAEYPPYGYMDENGEYTGFDLELAQAVCDLKGWELVKTPINWDSKDMELNSGSIDCIWNGFTMNGREDDYTWSKPYVNNSQVVVTAEDSGIEVLSDLAGKIVGVQTASSALDALNSDEHKDLTASFAALQEFGDYNNAFVELKAGAIDALAMDIGVAEYQLSSRGEGFRMLDENLTEEQYAIGFKKGNDALKDEVEEALDQLVEDGTYTKLAEKYELTNYTILDK